jgi:hypothetical protein
VNVEKANRCYPPFAIINPNKAWVSEEIEKIIKEWKDWNDYCQNLIDSLEYDANTALRH